jgi:hypothetical protein
MNEDDLYNYDGNQVINKFRLKENYLKKFELNLFFLLHYNDLLTKL